MSLITELWNSILVHPLINALVLLYDVLFHDLGLAIVVLTVVLRLALYPLFLQQLRSTRAQQEIAPAMAELKKKYKDDRQKFAEEQMKLYRERGVSPVSGCLPLLLQMPILFGLYSALSQVGCGLGIVGGGVGNCPGLTREQLDTILYPFVPNPIDPGATLGTFSILLPWSEQGLAHPDPLHIMPVIAAAVTLVSSLMTAPAKQPPSDDPTARTMGMMVWYTPIITLVFGFNLPAGLSLYWTVTTVFSILQQWFTSGWGRLGAMIPWLPEHLPSPAAPKMVQEEREIEREIERDLSTNTPVKTERRRRKRRR
ncbi:MAG: membrane protein insertase YidC [Chloroflexi bacterium]|nr:MAG: membrane protein insertase YidC [Chloroflexota bacterium]